MGLRSRPRSRAAASAGTADDENDVSFTSSSSEAPVHHRRRSDDVGQVSSSSFSPLSPPVFRRRSSNTTDMSSSSSSESFAVPKVLLSMVRRSPTNSKSYRPRSRSIRRVKTSTGAKTMTTPISSSSSSSRGRQFSKVKGGGVAGGENFPSSFSGSKGMEDSEAHGLCGEDESIDLSTTDDTVSSIDSSHSTPYARGRKGREEEEKGNEIRGIIEEEFRENINGSTSKQQKIIWENVRRWRGGKRSSIRILLLCIFVLGIVIYLIFFEMQKKEEEEEKVNNNIFEKAAEREEKNIENNCDMSSQIPDFSLLSKQCQLEEFEESQFLLKSLPLSFTPYDAIATLFVNNISDSSAKESSRRDLRSKRHEEEEEIEKIGEIGDAGGEDEIEASASGTWDKITTTSSSVQVVHDVNGSAAEITDIVDNNKDNHNQNNYYSDGHDDDDDDDDGDEAFIDNVHNYFSNLPLSKTPLFSGMTSLSSKTADFGSLIINVARLSAESFYRYFLYWFCGSSPVFSETSISVEDSTSPFSRGLSPSPAASHTIVSPWVSTESCCPLSAAGSSNSSPYPPLLEDSKLNQCVRCSFCRLLAKTPPSFPVSANDGGASQTAYTLCPLKRGEPLLFVPRHLILSSYDAHPRFRTDCFVAADHPPEEKRRCSAHEILSLQLLYELTLQKTAATICRSPRKSSSSLKKSISSQEGNGDGEDREQMSLWSSSSSLMAAESPPPSSTAVLTSSPSSSSSSSSSKVSSHPVSLYYLNSSKRNAPYFTPQQWQVIELILPKSQQRYRALLQTLHHLVDERFIDMFDNLSFPIQSLCSDAPPVEQDELPKKEDGSSDRKRRGEVGAREPSSFPSRSFSLPNPSDYQQVISVLMSRSLWDVEGNTAVTPVDEWMTLHWNSNLSVQHEADVDGFIWNAPKDMKAGVLVYANQEHFNNLRLLHQYGIVIEDNPWGPVWFFREEFGDLPQIANPSSVGGGIPYVATAEAAMRTLPKWTLISRSVERKWHYGDDPLFTGKKTEEIEESAASAAAEDKKKRIKEDENFSMVEGDWEETEEQQEKMTTCDMWTFYPSKNYKFGAILAQKSGEIGGFDPKVYICTREMKFAEFSDPVVREEKAASLFFEICQLHKEALIYSEAVLREEEAREKQKSHDGGDDDGGGGSEGGRGFEKEDSEVLREENKKNQQPRNNNDVTNSAVTRLMLRAIEDERIMMESCVNYFEMILQRLRNAATAAL